MSNEHLEQRLAEFKNQNLAAFQALVSGLNTTQESIVILAKTAQADRDTVLQFMQMVLASPLMGDVATKQRLIDKIALMQSQADQQAAALEAIRILPLPQANT